ncbi:hypothetical protein [Kineococcus aurantiacus]|uniref:Transcription regulator HTH AraC- type ligand binding domain-containing protein n=1 Tax=Kineococcus aurantiacus TaxID=37633 RepID=A0A7Y9AR61_9ACTN|nr:hypothetical protein [Kineococcus aurantiacus]NYD20480.1 hypothetical protein [Kineococcus aurantiacus]
MSGCAGAGPAGPHWRGARLSPSVGAWCHDEAPLRATRGARATRCRSGWVGFLVPGTDGATLRQARRSSLLAAGDLALVDLGSPFEYRSRPGVLSAVQVEAGALGLTAGQVRVAAPLLRTSSLHHLVRDHVQDLASVVATSADDPQRTGPALDSPALEDLGAATVRLLVALLLSCRPGPAAP